MYRAWLLTQMGSDWTVCFASLCLPVFAACAAGLRCRIGASGEAGMEGGYSQLLASSRYCLVLPGGHEVFEP
jgi:hypothetical protein